MFFLKDLPIKNTLADIFIIWACQVNGKNAGGCSGESLFLFIYKFLKAKSNNKWNGRSKWQCWRMWDNYKSNKLIKHGHRNRLQYLRPSHCLQVKSLMYTSLFSILNKYLPGIGPLNKFYTYCPLFQVNIIIIFLCL